VRTSDVVLIPAFILAVQADLPIEYSSAVCVRADENTLWLWKAMITVRHPATGSVIHPQSINASI
jgi:hypothetical protein